LNTLFIKRNFFSLNEIICLLRFGSALHVEMLQRLRVEYCYLFCSNSNVYSYQ